MSAQGVEFTDAPTLTGFFDERTKSYTLVFIDEAMAYDRVDRPHMTVKTARKEFMNDMVHNNGMESFWAVLRRAYVCIYHHMNAKHLHRYVGEFTGRHNTRPMDPEAQVALTVRNGDGKRLSLVDLIGLKHTRQPAKSAYYLISKSYIASEELLG